MLAPFASTLCMALPLPDSRRESGGPAVAIKEALRSPPFQTEIARSLADRRSPPPATRAGPARDGRVAAFRSGPSNLVPGDTNRASDVFAPTRSAPPLAAALDGA